MPRPQQRLTMSERYQPPVMHITCNVWAKNQYKMLVSPCSRCRGKAWARLRFHLTGTPSPLLGHGPNRAYPTASHETLDKSEKLRVAQAEQTRRRTCERGYSSASSSSSSSEAGVQTPSDERSQVQLEVVAPVEEEDWRAFLPKLGRVLSDEEAAAYWAKKLCPDAEAELPTSTTFESFHTACEHWNDEEA